MHAANWLRGLKVGCWSTRPGRPSRARQETQSRCLANAVAGLQYHRRPLLSPTKPRLLNTLLPLELCLTSLNTATPLSTRQPKPSPATGGRSGHPGRATLPAVDYAAPSPAAALQPSGKVRGSPGHLLRSSPAVASHQFPSPVRYRPPGAALRRFRKLQGVLCKVRVHRFCHTFRCLMRCSA
jgi:hypothetical protein